MHTIPDRKFSFHTAIPEEKNSVSVSSGEILSYQNIINPEGDVWVVSSWGTTGALLSVRTNTEASDVMQEQEEERF